MRIESSFIAIQYSRTAITLTLLLFAFTAQAQTTPTLGYQGRILRANGDSFELPTAQFRIEIRSPLPSDCRLYRETRPVNMANSNGFFKIQVNDGAPGVTVLAGSHPVEQALSNRKAFVIPTSWCGDNSGLYTPAANDGRRMVIEFYDGSAWETLPPIAMNYTPTTVESLQVGGFKAKNLLRVVDGSSNPYDINPLTNSDYDDLMDLLAGTSIHYTKPNELAGQPLPALTNGQAFYWNGSTWVAYTPLLTEADPTVESFAQDPLPTCAPGHFLRNDGTGALECVDAGGGGGSVSIVTGTGLTGGPITGSGTISLDALHGATGSAVKVNYDIYGRVTGAGTLLETDLPTIDDPGKVVGGAITSGTIGGSTAISTSGNITTTGEVYADSVSTTQLLLRDTGLNTITFEAPALGSSYVLVMPTSNGNPNQVLSTDGNGVLSWVDQSSLTETDPKVGTLTNTKWCTSDGTQVICNSDLPPSGTGDVLIGGNTVLANMVIGTDSNHALGFETNGTTKMTILENGNIGIGTENPLSIFHAYSDADAPTSLILETPGTQSNQRLDINLITKSDGNALGETANNKGWTLTGRGDAYSWSQENNFLVSFWNGTSWSQNFSILPTGKVGVGTTAPTAKLHVNATAVAGTITSSGVNVTGTGTNFTAGLSIGDRIVASNGQVKTVTAIVDDTTLTVNSAFSPDLSVATAYNKVGALLNSGFVGVGTATPTDLLELRKPASGNLQLPLRLQNIDSTASGGVATGLAFKVASDVTSGGYYKSGIAFERTGTNGRGNLHIMNNNGNDATNVTLADSRMTVLASGNVGIGTTSPARLLHVAGPMRLTASTAPSSPALGDMYVDTGDNKLKYYNGGSWVEAGGLGGGGTITDVTASGVLASSGGNTPDISLNIGEGLTTVSSSLTMNLDNGLEFNSGAVRAKAGDAIVVDGDGINVLTGTVAGSVMAADGVPHCDPDQKLQMGAGPVFNWTCVADLGITSETDPKIGTLTNTKWCTSDGTQVICNSDAPGGAGDVLIGGNTVASTMTIGTNSNHDLAFETNGTTKMTVLANGNVGIGTTNPSGVLHVEGGTSAAGVNGRSISLSAGTGGMGVTSAGGISMDAGRDGLGNPGSVSIMGKVAVLPIGITTSANSTGFDVLYSNSVLSASTATFKGANVAMTNSFLLNSPTAISIGAEAESNVMTLGTTAGSAIGLNATAKHSGTGTLTDAKAGQFQVTMAGGTVSNGYGVYIGSIAGTNKWSLYANDAAASSYFAGNVGIGTTTPSSSLEVHSTSGTPLSVKGNGSSLIHFDGNGVGGRSGLTMNGDGVNNPWFFGVQGTGAARGLSLRPTNNINGTGDWAMTVSRAGHFTFGYGAANTPSTVATVSVMDQTPTTGATKMLLQAGVDQGSTNLFEVRSYNATLGSGTLLNVVDANGNVGIGLTAPSEKLEVSGNVKATAFISTSDQRLKSNILAVEGLSAIQKLRGVRYNWIADGTEDMGVIAQEVEAVFPSAVVTDPRSGYKAVKYPSLIAPLIESVKEVNNMCEVRWNSIQRSVAQLQEENKELKAKVQSLEERMTALEKLLLEKK